MSIQTTINLHDIYQHVLTLSEELVTLARNSEWDDLIARETDYVCAVEHLTQLSHELEKNSRLPANWWKYCRLSLKMNG
ncbi:hypothetical protein [Morganella morganii]|uniref:hypothetical protein n=1 Tax=Morganella morganii TaxID=582 RepID=UPI001FFDC180|nr:hypothetical protein [Morganella morganii]